MTGRRQGDEVASAAAEATRCLALRARRLSRLVTKLYEDALRGSPITVAQFTLLGAIIVAGPLQPARLAELLDLEKSTLSRNLALLASSGLVELAPAGDGGQRAGATARGRRALMEALPAWRQAQQRAVAALGGAAADELDAMIAALSFRGGDV